MVNLPLKICQVNPGCGLEIPPKGWGAIEKIVWELTKNLRKQGHQVDIKWTNEVKKDEYDLVHVHVANLALILAEKGIPYIFQCHDHHAFHWGKNSFIFKQNLEAIEKSELSILPAKYLVDYFGSNKAVYFSHGVDTDFFTPNLEEKPHKLLMVANNGLGGKDGHDRKGFTEGIKAAKKIGLPITIVGPKNNKNFIKDNPWVRDYDINWIFDPNQEELLKIYQKHTIFLHPSELEAGHPNLTILEAMACGLPVVGCMENNLKGMIKVEKNTKSVMQGIQQVLKNYKHIQNQSILTANNLSWYNRSKELIKLTKPNSMKEILIKEYNTTTPLNLPIKPPPSIFEFSYINGPRCTIKNGPLNQYKINFKDTITDKTHYTSTIKNGMWTQCNLKYNIPWRIEVQDPLTNEILHTEKCILKNQRVYIHFDSKAIGDTLAWIPYVEKFREIYNCEVICSTFHNDWFEKSYPHIEFVAPGSKVPNIYAQYGVGWYYKDKKLDTTRNPIDPKFQPMQKTICDILGLSYTEIKPNISYKVLPKSSKKDYVVIAPHGTKHTSYWNYPKGWQTVIDYINSKGYETIMLSKEPLGDTFHDNKLGGKLINVTDKTGNNSFTTVFNTINHASALIGIGSGLSWISWALNTPTILISGFSEPYTEMQDCTRISTPKGFCTGCFNKHMLDPGDWEWCPEHKNTPRHFECTKSITPDLVIKEIDRILS